MTWALLMAWRDFRARPTRFLFYMAAIAVGVGSLAAIESFRRAVTEAIDEQGRNLLGADLHLRSIRPFTMEQQAVVDGWTGSKAQGFSYRTVLLEPRQGMTRLVEVEATETAFPFYGALETDPVTAVSTYREGRGVLLDQVLVRQMGLATGDVVVVGGQEMRVAGTLRQTPGDAPVRSLMAPKVMMPIALLDRERLSRPGTMARFEWYLATDGGEDAALSAIAGRARQAGLEVETVASRREQLTGNAERIGRYLGILGFTSLMIGCLGVAGAVHHFIAARRRMIAQLRCIGASLFQASGMFVMQLILLAVIGSTAGSALGAGAGVWLPRWFADMLPVAVDMQGVPWEAILLAWLTGVCFTVLAGMLPITRLRFISPMLSLRHQSAVHAPWFDSAGVAAGLLLAAALLALASYQLKSTNMAALYLGGMALLLGALMVTGLVLRWCCRRWIRPGWSYAIRLAVSGLYRPQNQTTLLVTSLGLGVFLMSTVDQMERHVLADVEFTRSGRPNIAMIDIQTDQRDAVEALLQRHQPRTVYIEPMITMRLSHINGMPVDRINEITGAPRPQWALKREYRTTYRAHVKNEIEHVAEGEWIRSANPGMAVIPISLEKGLAEDLLIGVGDRLTFDIHGEVFETRIANLREVNWKSMQPNFFVVFPPGVIDEAPQTILMFGQVDDEQARAAFQRELAIQFPNVTAIDISLVMEQVAAMMQQLAVAIRMLAWFTLGAGILVLIAVLKAGQMVREQETVLLRTIGADRWVILGYHVGEHVILGLVSLGSGLLLSAAVSTWVIRYVMELPVNLRMPGWWWTGSMLALCAGWAAMWSLRRLHHARPAQAWRELADQ